MISDFCVRLLLCGDPESAVSDVLLSDGCSWDQPQPCLEKGSMQIPSNQPAEGGKHQTSLTAPTDSGTFCTFKDRRKKQPRQRKAERPGVSLPLYNYKSQEGIQVMQTSLCLPVSSVFPPAIRTQWSCWWLPVLPWKGFELHSGSALIHTAPRNPDCWGAPGAI